MHSFLRPSDPKFAHSIPRRPLFKNREHSRSWVHLHLTPVRNGGSDIFVEPGEDWEIGQRSALHHYGVHAVEHEREWYNASRCHFVEHPRRSYAALGCIQNQYFADVGLASQFMSGARKYAGEAVKVVTRGKAVLRHERVTAYGMSHRL